MRIVVVTWMLLGISGAARADDGPPGAAPYVSPPPPDVRYVPYQPPPPYTPPPYAPPPMREVHYGATTLLLDGLAIGAITVVAVRGHGGELFSLGLSTYVFGAPIVHLAHREPSAALASLGLRGLLPIAGAVVAAKIGPRDTAVCDGDVCSTSSPSGWSIAIGLTLGAVAASVIDARLLARKFVVDRSPRFAPTAAVTPQGFSVGLGGSF